MLMMIIRNLMLMIIIRITMMLMMIIRNAMLLMMIRTVALTAERREGNEYKVLLGKYYEVTHNLILY